MVKLPLRALLVPRRRAHATGAWPLQGSLGGQVPEQAAAQGVVRRPGVAFRLLCVTTVLTIFGLVTLGGVVRLTGSGLGCPDWPLCHGKLIPPADTGTLIEYSHRMMASLAGALVLATAVVVWRYYRSQFWLLVPSTLGLGLLVVQVLLGGITVARELPSSMVLAHLAVAEALMACMVVLCVAALGGPLTSESPRGGGGWRRLPILTLFALLAAYALLLTGSYVTVSGSTMACGQAWPLCQGQVVPESYHPAVHMSHRVVALLVGLLIVTVVALSWRRRRERPALGWAAVAVGGTFLAQVLIGAATVWAGFPLEVRLLHLAMATVAWAGLATLAVISYTRPKYSLRGGIGA